MPTVLIKNGFRFFFFSQEGNEPCHIHVKKGDARGKIWLLPNIIKEDYLYGFTISERREINEILQENHQFVIEKWNEHFGR